VAMIDVKWDGAGMPAKLFLLSRAFWFGRYAVGVFIVISGYCLMLPVARSVNRQLPGGVWAYIRRRARRILPPYFAALGVSLLLIVLIPGMAHRDGGRWDTALPALGTGPIASHLLL